MRSINRSGTDASTDVISISGIGDVVNQALSEAGSSAWRGQVHSVFSRCAYLEFDTMLVCAALPSLGGSPISITFNPSCLKLPDSLLTGTHVTLGLNELRLASNTVYSLDNAIVSSSELPVGGVSTRQLHTLNALIEQLDIPEHGLAPVLLNPSQGSDKSALIHYVESAIDGLLNDAEKLCQRMSMAPVASTKHAGAPWDRLLGAGPGLTPSGDDFLSGVFHALHLMECGFAAQALWLSVEPKVLELTTDISAALLEQAAAGRASDRTIVAMNALLDSKTVSAEPIGVMLGNIGATSGWDWLAGFVMCLNHVAVLSPSRVHLSQSN